MAINDRDYALILGINDYPSYRGLEGAVADASKFRDWALDTSVGGGIPAKQCNSILSVAAPLKPLLEEIDDALEGLIEHAKSSGGARRFYLFFSGHGMIQVETAQTPTALCLGKWSGRRRNYALNSDCYINYVVNTEQFSEVILFADCCRVRQINAYGMCPTLGNVKPSDKAGQVRKFLAYASEQFDPAYEATLPEDATPAEEIRGHFSRALMAGLWGAAAESTGVPAESLRNYLYAEVPRLAKAAGHKQRPDVQPKYDPATQPIFGTASTTAQHPNVCIRFLSTFDGAVQLEGPAIGEMRDADASQGSWNLQLEIGFYDLRAVRTGREIRIHVRSTTDVLNVNF